MQIGDCALSGFAHDQPVPTSADLNLMTPEALEERLLNFCATVCGALRHLPTGVVGTHVAKQLVRSATSPGANYAEARSTESRRDFVHKMQICLKELRETSVWLRLAARSGLWDGPPLVGECRELIAIFVSSVTTAKGQRR